MLKIQWNEKLTLNEKIAIYKTVLAILERAGGSMDFNDFVKSIYRHTDFSKTKTAIGDLSFDLCAIMQELTNRGYIRLELRNFDTSAENFTPLVNVVRI